MNHSTPGLGRIDPGAARLARRIGVRCVRSGDAYFVAGSYRFASTLPAAPHSWILGTARQRHRPTNLLAATAKAPEPLVRVNAGPSRAIHPQLRRLQVRRHRAAGKNQLSTSIRGLRLVDVVVCVERAMGCSAPCGWSVIARPHRDRDRAQGRSLAAPCSPAPQNRRRHPHQPPLTRLGPRSAAQPPARPACTNRPTGHGSGQPLT
jgi:hypothetical protein